MASLVGDIIVRSREAFPDPPTYLSPPSANGKQTLTTGGHLANGTYYFQLTGLNQWGETLPTAEDSIACTGTGASVITFTPTLPPGTTGYRVYITVTTAGSELGYFTASGTSTLTVSTLTGLTPGTVPLRTSAWLPDTDGGFVSAATVYRWLNDALSECGRIAGGIPSVTAIQAINGQAMYRISGGWIKFTNCWFDGWPVMQGKRSDVFLHNSVVGIPGILTLEEWTDTTIIQMWPQPNRTGSTSTLSGDITATTDPIGVVDTSGFLPLGLAQIDSEVLTFSTTSGNQLAGCMRGVGGTAAAAHTNGTTVTELNLRLAGFRQPVSYAIGQSATSIPIVPGWDVPLSDYILAQYRRAEQQTQEAEAIEQKFGTTVKAMASQFRGRSAPRQIGLGSGIEVYPGSTGGGIILP